MESKLLNSYQFPVLSQDTNCHFCTLSHMVHQQQDGKDKDGRECPRAAIKCVRPDGECAPLTQEQQIRQPGCFLFAETTALQTRVELQVKNRDHQGSIDPILIPTWYKFMDIWIHPPTTSWHSTPDPSIPPTPALPSVLKCVKMYSHLSFKMQKKTPRQNFLLQPQEHLRNRPSLNLPGAEKPIHAFVFFKLAYCNAPLIGIQA